MSHLKKINSINNMNEQELKMKIFDWRKSWHAQYQESPYIYVSGFPTNYTEGDLITVFSQYGEINDINLIKDRTTGISKGFCFIRYESQLSTILAVDNFNGVKFGDHLIFVDHVAHYRDNKNDANVKPKQRKRHDSSGSRDSSPYKNKHKYEENRTEKVRMRHDISDSPSKHRSHKYEGSRKEAVRKRHDSSDSSPKRHYYKHEESRKKAERRRSDSPDSSSERNSHKRKDINIKTSRRRHDSSDSHSDYSSERYQIQHSPKHIHHHRRNH